MRHNKYGVIITKEEKTYLQNNGFDTTKLCFLKPTNFGDGGRCTHHKTDHTKLVNEKGICQRCGNKVEYYIMKDSDKSDQYYLETPNIAKAIEILSKHTKNHSFTKEEFMLIDNAAIWVANESQCVVEVYSVFDKLGTNDEQVKYELTESDLVQLVQFFVQNFMYTDVYNKYFK